MKNSEPESLSVASTLAGSFNLPLCLPSRVCSCFPRFHNFFTADRAMVTSLHLCETAPEKATRITLPWREWRFRDVAALHEDGHFSSKLDNVSPQTGRVE